MMVTTSTTRDEGNISAIPFARNNNLVAESDYYAAITALQQKFKEKQPSMNRNNDYTSTGTNDIEIQQKLYSDCSNSLCNQIQKIVQPISDEAFHAYLSRYNDNYVMCLPSTSNDHDDGITHGHNHTTPSLSTNVAVDDVIFTDDELMDHVAMKRVQELRQQVRDKVRGLLQLRQSTVQRAMSITERQMAVLLLQSSIQNQQNSVDDKNSSSSDNDGHDRATMTTEKLLQQHHNALQEMKESFLNLYETIHNNNHHTNSGATSMDSVLPTQIKNEYQNTIQVIEQGLLQHHPTTTSTNHLSQIEQAIYRRDYCHNTDIPEQQRTRRDEQMSFNNDDDDDGEGEQKINDPEDILFNLLCR